MSTTLTGELNSGITTGFCTVRTVGTCRGTTTGTSTALSKACKRVISNNDSISQTCPRSANCRISTGFCTVSPVGTLSQKKKLQLWKLHGVPAARWDHGHVSLHNDWRVKNLVQDLPTVESPRVSARSGPWTPVVKTTGKSKICNCGNSTGLLHGQDHGHLSQSRDRHCRSWKRLLAPLFLW